MKNIDLAIILQKTHEDEFDDIESDSVMVTMATRYAMEEFDVLGCDASDIGRAVLKLYSEVEA